MSGLTPSARAEYKALAPHKGVIAKETYREVLHELRSGKCPGCGNAKHSGVTFCRACWNLLTPVEQMAITAILKKRYVRAYQKIRERLRCEKQPALLELAAEDLPQAA